MADIIRRLDLKTIAAGVSANRLIFYCGPGVIEEVGGALLSLTDKGHRLYIVCDLDVQNDYRGLNDISMLSMLFNHPKVVVKRSKGINVCLFSDLDEHNYFIFPVSKIFKESPEGYDAVAFDATLAIRLFAQFFPEIAAKDSPKFQELFEAKKQNELSRLSQLTPTDSDSDGVDSETVNQEDISAIEQKVKEFPPEKPDLMRRVNFINTYIQVVDLKFDGANWQTRKVVVPKHLIPFKDETIKKNLESKLRLFSTEDKDKSQIGFNALRQKYDLLRKKYLFRSRLRDKSIIKLNEKAEFKQEVMKLQGEVNAFRDSLFRQVKTQIEKAKERITTELIAFYRENPTEGMKKYRGNMEEVLKDEVDHLVRHEMQFPKVDDIIGELNLSFSFLNFTYEDFEDSKFLEELAEWDKLSHEEYLLLFQKHKGFASQKTDH